MLFNVFSGVNYASKLALVTGKSIPVVFRQLDSLIKKKIIKKSRSGKKVEYTIQWNTIGNILFDIVNTEIKEVSKLKNAPKELNSLFKDISKNKTKKIILDILTLKPMQDLFKKLFIEINKTNNQKYKNLNFEESLSYFLDCFASMDKKEKESFLLKFTEQQRTNLKKFIKICQLHKIYSKLKDPLEIFRTKNLN